MKGDYSLNVKLFGFGTPSHTSNYWRPQRAFVYVGYIILIIRNFKCIYQII